MIRIKIGDSRNLIKEIEDKTFDCIMTSPPYWGLRDYGHDDQIGLESTPEKYLDIMWSLFDDIKMKLKDEGNCFVNLGDTYSGSGGAGRDYNKGGLREGQPKYRQGDTKLKVKCLCMIPHRFAWGMIERGWILRNEIIWHKPNHMPDSVTDRLTKSHEIIWHFVKQQKYYYDLDAIREPHKTVKNRPMSIIRTREDGYNGKYKGNKLNEDFSSPRARTQRGPRFGGNKYPGVKGMDIYSGKEGVPSDKGKNPGDVWQISTQPYPEAHFAVFPIELVRKPILSGCPPGGHVLDPFGGSGTVAEFCRKNDRDCTIFEINPEYESLIKERSMQPYPILESFNELRG